MPENHSLKDKRRVLKSIMTRVRNKYNVAIAEMDDQDVWQLATLAVACLSNDARQVDRVLSKVVDLVVEGKFDVEVLDCHTEIMPFP